MKPRIIFNFLILLLVLTGCYTQFGHLATDYEQRSNESLEDSSGASQESVVQDKDTVKITEREICIWRRDFFGDWELHCYKSNYAGLWHDFYHRPWWYNAAVHHSHACHCPYHRIYHPHCEYCWYFCHRFHYIHTKFKTGGHPPVIGGNSGNNPVNSSIQNSNKGPGEKLGRTKDGTVLVGPKPKKSKKSTKAAIPPPPEQAKNPSGANPGNSAKEPNPSMQGEDTTTVDSVNISPQDELFIPPKRPLRRRR